MFKATMTQCQNFSVFELHFISCTKLDTASSPRISPLKYSLEAAISIDKEKPTFDEIRKIPMTNKK